MAFEVRIYGNISENKEENNYTLKDLQARLAQYNNEPEVIVGIKTNGGSVYEGFAIYNELRRFASANHIKLTTRADGLVASIGTVIYLAGDKRIMAENIRPFIHQAYSEEGADASYENDLLADFYTKHTKMTLQEAKDIMKNDTFLSVEKALNYRFATEKEQIKTPEFLNKKNNMSTNNTKKPLLTRVWELFSSPVNKMEHDATNREVEFPDVETGGVIQIGDKATIDGKQAEGDIPMQDGTIYRFEAGILKEIIKKEQEIKKEETEIKASLEEALETRIKNLEQEVERIKRERYVVDGERDSLKKDKDRLEQENEKLRKENSQKEQVLNVYHGVTSQSPKAEKENLYQGKPNPLGDLENYNLNF